MAFPSIERNAKRLKIYIGESDQWRGRPLYAALLDVLKKEGLAGATVTRGVAGFGAHSRIHTASILDLSLDLPLIIEVVDSSEKISHALEMVSPMVREGLITLENVEVVAYTHRYLRPLPADRRVREVMTRDPISAGEEDTALAAWEKMLRNNIKALPVVDNLGRVVGVVTHDDFLERAGLHARLAVARQLDEASLDAEMEILRASNLSAKDIMSKPPLVIHPDDPIGLAAERMIKFGVTRLPVVEENGKLVGIVSRLDLLRQVINIQEKTSRKPQVRLEGRSVGEVMSPEIPLVGEDAELEGIIASFVRSGEHRVIVIDKERRPVGLISDSDLVGRIPPPLRGGILGALRGKSKLPDSPVTARELMSPGAETVDQDTSVVEAIQKMVQASRKWMVVVDSEGKPVGLVDREIALQALIR